MTTSTLADQIAAIEFAIKDAFNYDESDITIPRDDVDKILASLQRLDAIDKVKVPEPLTHVIVDGPDGKDYIGVLRRPLYGHEIIDELRAETVAKEEYKEKYLATTDELIAQGKRAVKAEAERDALRKDAERYR